VAPSSLVRTLGVTVNDASWTSCGAAETKTLRPSIELARVGYRFETRYFDTSAMTRSSLAMTRVC